MQKFFQFHSKLDSFRLFSMEHLGTIGIIVVLCVLLFVYRKNWLEARKRRSFRLSLAFLLVISDTLQQIWLVNQHAWSIKRDLPLQLSDLSVLLAVVMLLAKSEKLFQFLFFAGLGSSIQAILTPDLDKFSFPHFQYIEFFISHGGVVLACLFMVEAFSCRPTIRSLWITVLIVNLYAVCIYFLNKIIDANYLYIMRKPGNASLLDYFGQWPWYLLSMELVMILSFFILYGIIAIFRPHCLLEKTSL
ncbi:TIGR02206 family membrane protein [Bacillus sp. EB600]|uniref:YwaF family protein n=1 Tax=Bacillus sp. EB600 TaxID=2806345 RepID=UPI0021089BC7|nr:TIGR02206 family membrane protein [Bacillus sp. EB600]MCQ6280761.1 TIGR02206 family membrane protein [Bacillus sp. EB600]